MTRDELIKLLKDNSDAVSSNGKLTISRTSKELLAQKLLDLQELAVIEGKLELLKSERRQHWIIGNDESIVRIDLLRSELETTRQNLLTKLGLDE